MAGELGGHSNITMSEMPPAVTLESLPEELLMRILYDLASSPTMISAVSSEWCRLAPIAAEHWLHSRHGLDAHLCPCALRAARTLHRLTEAVGDRPPHAWRAEWTGMRIEQARLVAVSRGTLEAYLHHLAQRAEEIEAALSPGGALSVEAEESRGYARSIQWKLTHGWPAEAALAGTLLCSCGSGALRQIQTRSTSWDVHAGCTATPSAATDVTSVSPARQPT